MSKKDWLVTKFAWAWLIFTVGAFVLLAHALSGCDSHYVRASPTQEPFTAIDCTVTCKPIGVLKFLPGFCRIPNDQTNLVRCDSPSSTETVMPIYDVCSCGIPTVR